MKGKVKWFSKNKGYGFITGEDGKEYFVHWQSIQGEGYKTLIEDDNVEFKATETEKGIQAIEVSRINSPDTE
ncbi:MAG: cold shock domain-containing protein [Candidatus Cloacimonadota bacterium]|nr:cold shock domain-containing protein [Candidatus Cloacimonadota bacterium]